MSKSEGAAPTPPPLKKHWFQILLALADGPQHGYAIRARVEEHTSRTVTLYPATLYGSVREMAEGGLIEEADGPDEDRRRRYYGLTALGREALRLEVARMQGLLDVARASRAFGGA